jgi:hypothetical protein
VVLLRPPLRPARRAATLDVTQFTIPDPSAAGKTKPNPAVGTYLVGWEYGTIAKKWVQQAQAWTGGNVPVVFEADRVGTRERNFEGADFKKLGTVLSQLTEIDGRPRHPVHAAAHRGPARHRVPPADRHRRVTAAHRRPAPVGPDRAGVAIWTFEVASTPP